MTTYALSTMYAQQERFADGAVFARYAAAAGYDAIEVSHSTPPEKLEGILAARALPVTSIHLPAPWVKQSDGRGNSGRCAGAHVHDVRGPASDHKAPGAGDVAWDYLARGLAHLDSYTLEINQWQTDEGVAGAPAFLRSVGLT